MPHQRLKTTALCTGLKQGKECRSHRLMSRKETDMYLRVFRATEGRVYFAQFRIKELYIPHSLMSKKRGASVTSEQNKIGCTLDSLELKTAANLTVWAKTAKNACKKIAYVVPIWVWWSM